MILDVPMYCIALHCIALQCANVVENINIDPFDHAKLTASV